MERYIRTQSSPPQQSQNSTIINMQQPSNPNHPHHINPLSQGPHPQAAGMKKIPSNASIDRVVSPAKMVALQAKGSNSSLNNLRQSLMIADNPRRGSATGVYGLPVPPDNLKLGGTHIPSECNSLNDSPNNSGRNSPIGWTQHQSNHDKRKSTSAKQQEIPRGGFSGFNSLLDEQKDHDKDQPEKLSWPKKLLKYITFGLSGDAEGPGCMALLLALVSVLLCLATLPVSLIFCVKVVKEYERAVIFRLGRLRSGGAKGPGIFFIVPCIDTYKKLDLRTVSFDVPPQEILSRDSVTVSVDAVVYYRVSNPTMATNNVEDYRHSTHLLAATTLRNVLGTKCLDELLSEREQIAHYMETTLDEATDPWGVKVERVEVKDVRLPIQLQRAMAAEAEAARESRAKVIAAEGEKTASVALRAASDNIAGNHAAMQLRYLQTLSSISCEKNSTIIFPVPIDILSGLYKKES